MILRLNLLISKCIEMKKLTIIISFLNEKEEVEKTLQSIFDTADNNLIDVIVINDSSDDGFDYDSIAEKYSITYYKLTERHGIARCRDLAIEKCQTKFFLLLDSHMRFYDELWVERIVTTLIENPRTLLCCDNKALQYVEGKIEEVCNTNYYGAIINFYDNKAAPLLTPMWNTKTTQNYLHPNIYLISCVLGAAYACSKEYWTYLKGLKGLELYGFDEPYISLKVWLEGGKCILDKNVCVGHIYRSLNRPVPYSFPHHCYYYNCLLISILLLPDELKGYIFYNIRISVPFFFNEALYKLYDNRKLIVELKKEYEKILKNDFSTFELLNNADNSFKPLNLNPHKKLEEIANYILYNNSKANTIGLYDGKMGVLYFLYKYSEFSKQKTYKHVADLMLDDVLSSIDENYSINLYSGYCGIGVGLIFLIKDAFVMGDENIVLEEIDNKIEEVDVMNIQDINLLYGLGGICLYILLRLYAVENNETKKIFSDSFLNKVYMRVKQIIQSRECKCDCIDIYMRLLLFIEEKNIYPISINDILFIDYPKKIFLKKQKFGLAGLSGLGIKLLSEGNFMKSFSYSIIKR